MYIVTVSLLFRVGEEGVRERVVICGRRIWNPHHAAVETAERMRDRALSLSLELYNIAESG